MALSFSPLPLPLLLLPAFLLLIPSLSSPIEYACNATQYPTLCISSLSNSTNLTSNPTPNDIIAASISISLDNNRVAQSKAESILRSSSNVNRTNVAKSCIEGFLYSGRRLSAASRTLLGGGDIADVRAWASAASQYHFGCWSGLKLVNDTDEVADTILYLSKLTNLTSNALSMVTALQRFGDDTSRWAPPQTERDGYWGPPEKIGASGGWAIGVPSDLVPNATVCASGCAFGSVQAAVDVAPVNGKGRFVIYIKEGVYEEIVRVGYAKKNLVFVGDGIGKTVLTGSLSVGYMVGLSTYNTATLGVVGDGFMATNLTIRNTSGPDAHQAVAFRSSSDRSILENVEFVGLQDTLYPHSLRQLYKSCIISGTVDFIFGGAAAIFQNSLILIVPRQLNPDFGGVNTVTAHGRTDPAQSTGFVFYNCTVNGSDEYLKYYYQKPALHRNYLGRPWKEYSRTVFIICYLENIIRSEGWMVWNGDFALNTLFYGEFKSQGPGANVTGRVPWSSQVPEEHLGVYSVQNFIQLGVSSLSFELLQNDAHLKTHRTQLCSFLCFLLCCFILCFM